MTERHDPRPRLGRPPQLTAPVRVTVNLDAETHQRAVTAATARGLSLSEWIRFAILKTAK